MFLYATQKLADLYHTLHPHQLVMLEDARWAFPGFRNKVSQIILSWGENPGPWSAKKCEEGRGSGAQHGRLSFTGSSPWGPLSSRPPFQLGRRQTAALQGEGEASRWTRLFRNTGADGVITTQKPTEQLQNMIKITWKVHWFCSKTASTSLYNNCSLALSNLVLELQGRSGQGGIQRTARGRQWYGAEETLSSWANLQTKAKQSWVLSKIIRRC